MSNNTTVCDWRLKRNVSIQLSLIICIHCVVYAVVQHDKMLQFNFFIYNVHILLFILIILSEVIEIAFLSVNIIVYVLYGYNDMNMFWNIHYMYKHCNWVYVMFYVYEYSTQDIKNINQDISTQRWVTMKKYRYATFEKYIIFEKLVFWHYVVNWSFLYIKVYTNM